MNKLRDKIAHAVSNWFLNHIATEEYRERLEFTIVLGMIELEKRAQEERDYIAWKKGQA